MTSKKIQSLHSHTLLSDGKLTHKQSLDLAQELGIGVLAFTEHDCLPTEKELREVRQIKTQVKWLIGIEITVSKLKEAPDAHDLDIHLLGHFVNPNDKKLLEHCDKALENRIHKMRTRVKKLAQLGFKITEDEVFKAATGKAIGLPHLVAAIKSKSENVRLIDHFMEEMKKRGESDERWNSKYKLLMQQGERQFPYKLFFNGKGSFVEIESDSQYDIDLDQATKIIRDAGGVSSIAHYTTSKYFLPPQILDKIFEQDRVDGAETAYGFWGFGNDQQKEIEEDRMMLRELVLKYDKVATGGGDTHSEKDFHDFAQNSWLNGETVGMVEKVIEKFNPSLEFSNLKN